MHTYRDQIDEDKVYLLVLHFKIKKKSVIFRYKYLRDLSLHSCLAISYYVTNIFLHVL